MNDAHALPKLCWPRLGAGAGDQALKNAWRIRGTFPKVGETLRAARSPAAPRASVPGTPAPARRGRTPRAPRLLQGGLTRGPGCGEGCRLPGAPPTSLSLWAAACDWLRVPAPPPPAPPRAPPALPPAEVLGEAGGAQTRRPAPRGEKRPKEEGRARAGGRRASGSGERRRAEAAGGPEEGAGAGAGAEGAAGAARASPGPERAAFPAKCQLRRAYLTGRAPLLGAGAGGKPAAI